MKQRWSVYLAAALTVWLWSGTRCAYAQQVVLVTLPTGVSFNVNNVTQSTAGSPSATPVSFTVVNLALFHVLRVSVKADSDFTPPSGTAIPASKVSWTTSGGSGATGSNGQLSTTAYTQVFQMSNALIGLGSINVHWTLGPPGGGIRAGNHTMVVRWRFESVVP